MSYKLGKLGAQRSPALSDLMIYATGKLPAPPSTLDAPANVTWGMDDNDRLGCCTIAGVDHLLAAWNAEYSESDSRPDDAEIQSTYFGFTGGQDTGCVEQTVLQAWQSKGIFGNKIDAFAPFNGKDIKEHQQAVAFYGGSYLGIQCPQSAQEQFQDGKPWTYVKGSPIEGGHCIVGVGYTDAGILAVTWGGVTEVTWSFLSHYLDESWAAISHEIVERGDDGRGLDLKSLLADIAKI